MSIFSGGIHHAFQADLGSTDGIRSLHSEVTQKMGPIDVLYVNHGIIGHFLGRDGDIENLDVDMFEHTWRNNTLPSFVVRCSVTGDVVEAPTSSFSSRNYAYHICGSRIGEG
jgi:NAD(P)-dependent dehydrogenase (short-subunit alcohol dehydrogenase family)